MIKCVVHAAKLKAVRLNSIINLMQLAHSSLSNPHDPISICLLLSLSLSLSPPFQKLRRQLQAKLISSPNYLYKKRQRQAAESTLDLPNGS